MPGLIKVKRLHLERQRVVPRPRMGPTEVALVANAVEKLLDERIARKKALGLESPQQVEEITEWR